jgi:uncharacterized protein (DUF2141 family)
MTAYYELVAATPNAEQQISSSIVPAAQKAGAKGGASAGSSLGSNLVAGLKKFAAPMAAALSVAGVSKFVKDSVASFSTFAGSISSLQRITGGTTEQVSGLQGAMRLSGMDASKANTSLTIFAKKLQGVSGDSEKTAAMQQLLGTSITDANGQMKPMTELLPQVADTFKNMPDGVQKTALATQLFGKSGTAMLPFLNKGADGIGELEGKAKQLGITLDDSSKSKWAAYRAATRNVNLSMEGLRNTVGAALIPVFTGFSDFITNSVTPTLQELIKWFQSPAVQDFANQAGQALSDFGTKASEVFDNFKQKLSDLFNWVTQNKDWLSAIATGIGLVAAAFKAWQIVQAAWNVATKAATAIQSAFNLVMNANPIMLVITVLAALVAALVYFFTQTDTGRAIWSSFMDWLQSAWQNISGFFQGLWDGIVGFFQSAGTNVQNAWNAVVSWFQGIPGAIGGFFSGIGASIGGFFQSAANGVSDTWNGVVDWFKGIPGRVVDAIGDVGGLLKDAGSAIINGFLDGLKGAWDGVTGFVGGIADWIKEHKGPLSYDATLLVPAGNVIMGGFGKALRNSWDANVEPYVLSRNQALQSMLVTPSYSAALVGSGGVGGSMVVNAPITVNTSEADGRVVGNQVARQLLNAGAGGAR